MRAFRSILVVLSSITLASCGSCKKVSDDEVLIGAYLSLSGADATYGIDIRDGAMLAFEEINAAGGVKHKKISVLYEDDKSLTTETSLVVRKLIERDHVVALLGEVGSSRSLVGGLIANTSQVPMLTPSATAVEVTQGREWVFRNCFTDDFQGQAAARFVKLEPKNKRIAIVYAAQDTYSSGLAKSFREELARLGGTEIVIEKGYQKGETSYRTQLAEVRDTKPDVIFAPIFYADMVLIARQAKEIGIDPSKFLGGDGWDAANLLEGAGAELEGSHFTDHYAPDLPGPEAAHFREAFKARFKRDPGSGQALGYDAARLLADAINRAPEITRPAIRKALEDTKDFTGVTGKMSMDPNHNPKKPVVVSAIRGGKFVFAATP